MPWRRWGKWLALGLAGVAVLWVLGRTLIRLPWQLVNEVAVIGTRNVDSQVIRDQAQVTLGVPLFSVNVDSVVSRVKMVPWVQDASVTRRFSGRFEIHVEERVPIGMIWQDRFYLMDPSGFICPFEGEIPPDVPLVTGLSLSDSHLHAEVERVAWALRLISELDPLRSVVSEISLADSATMVMVLSPRGVPVLLPRYPGRDRLVMVASLVAHYPDVLRQARYLDDRFVGHVAVSS